ncbi:IclR family transcriptional regulator, partial [Streptomyces sp. UH6]|nr:IclR family transcriptional regulator [Streptomyces sp. UH6]
FGEVEPGAHGVAVPIEAPGLPAACLNLITYRSEIAQKAPASLIAASARLAERLA